MQHYSEIISNVSKIEQDILSCGEDISERNGKSIENIKNMFDDPIERSIGLLVRNAFQYYDWNQTKHAFGKSIDSFLLDTPGKSVVFIFHSEAGSATSQNKCHQKSSFFFSLLALKIRPELKSKTIGFICNSEYTIEPKLLKNRNDIVYCICEDSIYTGNQIKEVVSTLDSKNKLDISKLHIISPFVREEFSQQSESKKYTLHTHVLVQSLASRLTDKEVISSTCDQIKQLDGFSEIDSCKTGSGIESILNIFPHRNKHSPVFFSHKIADSVSLPLAWIMGILNLGNFPLEDENSHVVNEHVKTSKGDIWSCIRGPYKNHSDSLLVLFNNMFSGSFKLKTSVMSRFISKIKK